MKVFSSVTVKPLKDWRIIQMTLHYLGRKGRSFFFLHRQEETQCVTFVVPLQILLLNSCCGFLLFLGSSPFHHPEVLSVLKVTKSDRQPTDFLSCRPGMCISNDKDFRRLRILERFLMGLRYSISSSFQFLPVFLELLAQGLSSGVILRSQLLKEFGNLSPFPRLWLSF